MSNLKSTIDRLDFNILVPASVDLSKLSEVTKNNAAKMAEYNKLVNKYVNNINTTNTSNFDKKIEFDTKINEIKKMLLMVIMLNMLLLKNATN